MNILYIVGNGFDVAQGLHTKYSEFEKYYKKLPSSTQTIEKFKQDIKPENDQWSDLEVAFGQYTSQISTEQEVLDIYFDLHQEIQEYMKKENDSISIPEEMMIHNIQDAISPEKYLEQADQDIIERLEYELQHVGNNLRIDAISFNYTTVFDRLLGFELSQEQKRMSEVFSLTQNIYHIHGVLTDSQNPIMFGVDNVAQITNPKYHNSELINCIVKPKSNEAIKSIMPQRCHDLITNADIIVLYGTSIGATDQTWWKEIYNALNERQDLYLIIHKFWDKPLNLAQKPLWLPRITQACQKEFLMQAIGDEEISNEDINEWLNTFARNRIFVAINKPLFQNFK